MVKEKVFSGHQPNFLPYMGFFYKIFKADIFVLDDDVQYTTAGCHQGQIVVRHNSNVIRVGDKAQKIVVPVKKRFADRINDVEIVRDDKWKTKMIRTVELAYSKHPYSVAGMALLDEALSMDFDYLADLNMFLIDVISKNFGFQAKIASASRDVPTKLKSNARNVFQCKKLGCDVYYSGIGGKAYNDESAYAEQGIRLEYSDYKPVRYRQYHKNDFIENLSVLDYIMNCGYAIPEGWCK